MDVMVRYMVWYGCNGKIYGINQELLGHSGYLGTISMELFTQASVGKPASKNGSRSSFYLVAKWGVIVPGVPSVVRGNWGRECDTSRSSLECCVSRKTFVRDSTMLIAFGTAWPTNYIA